MKTFDIDGDARCLRVGDIIPAFEYSLADFEVDLWINRFHIDQNIRMAGLDKEIFPATAAARQDALQWIFEGLAVGYTVIFNKLNLYNPRVAELCQVIWQLYPENARPFVTAFLSPSSQHCFGYHYDEVDVFLVQIHGSKSWSVAGPCVPFPIEGMHKPPVDQDQTEGEYLRVELLPGDVLFIPRGHIHRGLPGGEGSLHLSVGIHVPTITDGIIERLREASLLDEVLRRPLSAGQQREDVINTTVQTLTQWNAKTPRQKHRVYLPENSLTSMLRIGTLALDDVLVRAGGKPLIYRLTPDFSTIEIDGLLFDYGVRLEKIARVALPAGYFSALQMINEKPDVTARSLVQALSIPITDALELGRKLLTIGVLEYQQC